ENSNLEEWRSREMDNYSGFEKDIYVEIKILNKLRRVCADSRAVVSREKAVSERADSDSRADSRASK
ncbi:9208_t:CDS:2, partial [Racocetra persica]